MDLPLTDLPRGQLRPLRRVEYEQLVCQGYFVNERIELLGGLLVAREPQSPWHADAIDRLGALFSEKLAGRVRVRVAKPLALGENSEPEPDLALVAPGDYRTAHPSAAFLVVEVADSSVTKDERLKSAIYGGADIDEYWVVDLNSRAIRVFRDRAGSGPGWGRIETIVTGCVSPAAFPDVSIDLEEIFGGPL